MVQAASCVTEYHASESDDGERMVPQQLSATRLAMAPRCRAHAKAAIASSILA